MGKKALLVSLILLLAGLASADQVYYDIEGDEDAMTVNTTVRMDCDSQRCPTLVWNPPDDSEVERVADTSGEIDDYEFEDDKLNLRPKNDVRKDNETYKLTFHVDRGAEDIYRGLYQRELSLPSFNDVDTRGSIRVDGLLSSWSDYGVNTSIEGESLSFQSRGPVNLRLKFGMGNRTDYYEFFGGDPENSSMAFEVAAGTTGRDLEANRLPVALLPDDVFNETVSRWSSGEYLSGSAKMRQNLEDEFLPVLGHETVHALNERELNWDKTSSSYSEEGTARYVESQIRKKLYREGRVERPPRELFGDDVRYDPDPMDNYYMTLQPKGDADVLWGYYQNDEDFMKRWNPFDSPAEYRGFGYAYSELIIKNYVVNENGSVRQLYEDIEGEEKIRDSEKKWELFSEHLDLTPCKYQEREKFEQCLNKINDYNYTVYSAEPALNDKDKALDIEELEVPERKEPPKNDRGDKVPEFNDDIVRRVERETFIDKVLTGIGRAFTGFMETLQSQIL